jgi:endo-1,4-beta-xylanase
MMGDWSRREFLGLGAAAAAGAWTPWLAADVPAPRPLRSLVRPGVRIGAQAGYADLLNPRLAAFLAANFNTLTAGNELKWGSLRPTPESYNFTRADAMVDFAERHQMHFHGHNLCWNHWLPGWAAATLTRANAERYLTDHIATVAGRYKGRIDSWDVVNEPLGTWRTPAGQPLRPWLDLIGPEYLDVAFHAAAQADPGALRVLNFDRLEQSCTANDDDRRSALAMIEGLVKRGAPIQAVGFESHLAAWDAVENASQDRLVQAVRGLGLKVLFTELEVNDTRLADGRFGTSTSDRDQAVAAMYFDYLTRMVPRAGCEQVIFWTPWDGSDWLDGLHGRDFDRADGRPHRPGLIDTGMQPKPAYYSVARALQQLFSGTGATARTASYTASAPRSAAS